MLTTVWVVQGGDNQHISDAYNGALTVVWWCRSHLMQLVSLICVPVAVASQALSLIFPAVVDSAITSI